MKTYIVKVKDIKLEDLPKIHTYTFVFDIHEYNKELNEQIIQTNIQKTAKGISALDAAKKVLPINAEIRYVLKDGIKIKSFTSSHLGEEWQRGTIDDLINIEED